MKDLEQCLAHSKCYTVLAITTDGIVMQFFLYITSEGVYNLVLNKTLYLLLIIKTKSPTRVFG